MPHKVVLPWADIRHGVLVGVARRHAAIQQGRNQPLKSGNAFYPDICGALAEQSIAYDLDVYWKPNIGGCDARTGDVCGYEVRGVMPTTKPPRLLVKHADADDARLVCVTGTPPVLEIQGWIYAGDARKAAYAQYEDCAAVALENLMPWNERPM